MNLTINGQTVQIETEATVLDLLQQYGLASERVAVECNGVILDVATFAKHYLAEGDVLEIVRFVGGG